MEFLKEISPRKYQQEIFQVCKEKNCLVVLPTGLGKTLIALMLAIERITKFPKQKVIFLAPTKPLAEQHLNFFVKHLPELFADMQLFTGAVPPEQRKKLWETANIIFSTPQCVANDLRKNLYDLEEVSLLIEDEAHRCIKNYDYNYIAKIYKKQSKNPRILGLTASPSSDKKKLDSICKNLSAETVELRTRDSPDVKEYLQKLTFKAEKIDFPPEFEEIRQPLKKIYNDYIDELKSRNLLYEFPSKTNLIKLQKRLGNSLNKGNSHFNIFRGISACANAIKLQHALELLETQTLESFNGYLKKLFEQSSKSKSKSIQRLVKKPEFNFAFIRSKELLVKKTEHPKLEKVKEIVKETLEKNPNARIIIFSQYRNTAALIASKLNEEKTGISKVFVGQSKKAGLGKSSTGLSQKEQKQVLIDFSEGKINNLCATSVHPDEYIVLKKENTIMIKKIGEFVNSFIKEKTNKTLSKKISGWEALSSNGKDILFKPITQVHKHPIQNKMNQIKLSSGFDCFVTENHSLFTFNQTNPFVQTCPEKNKFVALTKKIKSTEENIKMDIIKELKENAENKEELFGSLEGLTQAKIRLLKTDLKILSSISKNKKSIIKITNETNKNYSTVMNCLKRLKEKNAINQIRIKKNYKNLSKITKTGKEYLNFLEWFFKNVKYYKKKYRFKISGNLENKKEFGDFFGQTINVNYGKTSFPRVIELNEALARFLGFYVSEGSSRKTKYTSEIFLAARDKNIQEMMKESVEKGLKLKTRRNWRGIAIDSQIAHHLIKCIFKAGIGAYQKEVPEIIFTAPANIKWEFLKAYFLGDGHLGKNRITFTTVSRKLVIGLVLLLRILGIEKITLQKQKNVYRLNIFESLPFAKIKEKNEKRRKAYYSLIPQAVQSKRAFDNYGNFYSSSKSSLKCRKNGKWENDICYDYIKDIKEIKNPKFVYDLSVEKTENFIGGTGLFCLHNSIGEEGLDIPEVNKVIFYEPVPSEIRKIQRCLPSDSKILMEKGNYKEVSKICKREKIISYNEKKDELEAKEVLGVFKNGVQKIIEVITEKNNQIRLTKNHPILTPSGWINAGNLKKSDIIAICHSPNTKTNYNSISDFLPKETYICNNENLKIAMNKKKLTYEDLQKELSHLGHKINKKTLWSYINRYSIPIHIFKSMMEILELDEEILEQSFLRSRKGNKITLSKVNLSELMWLAGIIASDGDLRIQPKIRDNREIPYFTYKFRVCNSNKEILLKAENILEKIGLKTRREGKDILEVNNTIIGKLLNNLGIPVTKKSKTIELSDILFQANSEAIEGFLSGIFDGDGNYNKEPCQIRLGTASKKFAFQLQSLLLKAGINSKICQFDKTETRNIKGKIAHFRGDFFSVEIYKKSDVVKFLSMKEVTKIKNAKIYFKYSKNKNIKKNIFWVRVKKINELSTQEVFNLEVKDNNTFIADNILVHNSGRTARLLPGELTILITKKTRDESFYWASFSREKKMYKMIKNVKDELKQKNLNDFQENETNI